MDAPDSLADFIHERMPLRPVTGVPEISLHLATPASGLGRRVEAHGGDHPYWAYVWGGGLALARYILDRPETVRGRRVLDLGAGSGLATIAAVLAGAADVTASEVDPDACLALALNLTANHLTARILSGDLLDKAAPAVDLVLASDVFYEPSLAERVTPFLDRCLAGGIEVLVGDPYRAALPRRRLTRVAQYLVADFGEDQPRTKAGVFRFVST